jgi:hypothetical protein
VKFVFTFLLVISDAAKNMTSNNRMINESRFRKDAEERGRFPSTVQLHAVEL